MTNANSGIERKSYNRFVAQTAKNIVKKRFLEIRRGGARAADEIIDQLLNKNGKNKTHGTNAQELNELERIARAEIEKDRGKWRNFIIEAAMRFDIEALACFGVNFIYGGLLTSSVGNVGWASVIEIETNADLPQDHSANAANKGGGVSNRARIISETVSRGRSRGNMVWILKGRGLYDPDMLKIYRFEPDIAFILLEEPDKNGIRRGTASFDDLSRLKNVLSVIPASESDFISNCGSRGIIYAVSSVNKTQTEGKGELFSVDLSRGRLPIAIEGFIKHPSFPIIADGMIPLFNCIEYILSSGRSKQIPVHRI